MSDIKKAFSLLFCILLLAGCATRQDMQQVRAELENKTSAQARGVEAVTQENAALRKALESNQEAIAVLRKAQADSDADMAELKDRLRQINGQTEELRKDLSTLSAAKQKKDDEIKEKLDSASFKINFVENFLGIGKKEEGSNGTDRNNRSGNGQHKDAPKGKTDRESAYAAAYETFKGGQYEKARTEFLSFLKLYPKSEYSGNAQFWIGECYYNEQKYERAILEYEKVVKDYPDGNKVPYALLKQGLSFQKLGDKTSAKLILQQIIRDFPNTNQAKVARAKLMEIK